MQDLDFQGLDFEGDRGASSGPDFHRLQPMIFRGSVAGVPSAVLSNTAIATSLMRDIVAIAVFRS
jgi:hypothetical protein